MLIWLIYVVFMMFILWHSHHFLESFRFSFLSPSTSPPVQKYWFSCIIMFGGDLLFSGSRYEAHSHHCCVNIIKFIIHEDKAPPVNPLHFFPYPSHYLKVSLYHRQQMSLDGWGCVCLSCRFILNNLLCHRLSITNFQPFIILFLYSCLHRLPHVNTEKKIIFGHAFVYKTENIFLCACVAGR